MDRHEGFAGSTGFIVATGLVVMAGGLGLGLLRFVNGVPPEHDVEGAVGALALGAVAAAAGVLALLALRDRPTLLLPAAFVLMPLSMLSFALVTLPLLIPCVLLFLAYGQRSDGRQSPVGTTVGVLAAVLTLLVAAVVVLFVHQDPRSYVTANGGGSTSDVITFAESIPSLALTASAIAAGWVLSAPRRPALRE